jgi:DNA-3-methyladenine glycosylase II
MTDFPHPPAAAIDGLRQLTAADPDLAGIIPAAGPLPWRVRPAGFTGLLQAIVGQQISNAAAAAIWRRLQAVPGALDPGQLLGFDPRVLQGAGLSRPKVAHAFSLAEAFATGHLETDALAEMDDEAAIARICTVRGMGRWSAEIYLLFALGRPDVFPGGDLALAAAAAAIKRLDARPKPKALVLLAEQWQPWRGLAARLLWHHWRFLTGRPAMDDLPLV